MVAEGGEGENPLPFSLTAPKCGGGWGYPGFVSLEVLTFEAAVSAETAWRVVFVGKRPQAPGGPGPKPWGPGPKSALETCASGVDFLQPSSNPRLLPQSADLGGRWMVSEGGALQSLRQEFQKCFGAYRLMKSLACCTD